MARTGKTTQARVHPELVESARAERLYGRAPERKLTVAEKAELELARRIDAIKMNEQIAAGGIDPREQDRAERLYGDTTPKAKKRAMPKSTLTPTVG